MATFLVAGATGQLGRPTLDELRRRGHDARGLSRSAGPRRVAADLLTGQGLPEALAGVDVVIHVATTGGKRDADLARILTAAARTAGVRHLVAVSIVGVDRVPLGFYRDRLHIEEILAASGVPFSIQRATQFHSFPIRLFEAQRRLPAVLVPSVRFQTIAVEDVAARLADLAEGQPVKRAADIGGPEVRTAGELAALWKEATGVSRRLVPFRLPGRLFAALDAGANLVPGDPWGKRTFAEHLAATSATSVERAESEPGS